MIMLHAFSTHKLPEQIDYGDDVRKFNETHAGSGYLNGS